MRIWSKKIDHKKREIYEGNKETINECGINERLMLNKNEKKEINFKRWKLF
jgi:hypothetical protein